LIGVDATESFARLAGALSLLASYKLGRAGWLRGRRSAARDPLVRARKLRPRNPSSRRPGAIDAATRDRLRAIAGLAWVLLLLAVLGYAAVAGEEGIARFDELYFRIGTL
jgi:hypothetical protein